MANTGNGARMVVLCSMWDTAQEEHCRRYRERPDTGGGFYCILSMPGGSAIAAYCISKRDIVLFLSTIMENCGEGSAFLAISQRNMANFLELVPYL